MLQSLHDEGIDRNGRLPSEHHKYQDTGMDDQATQPTTQPQDDTRRHGSNSRLSKQDETDVVVLLHPSSPAAFVAVDLTADAAPQHIQQNHDQSYIEDTSDTELEGTSITSKNAKDIALRLSSRVNDIRMGFIFGRNTSRSDILLVRDIPKGTVEPDPRFAVSNKHFRIYVNHNGIVMLEDISTNGTIVDNIVLHGPKAPDQSANHQPKTTLAQGSVIEVPISGGGDSIRFIVGLPDRYEGSKKYGENLGEYLSCVQQAERKTAAIAKAVAKKEKVPSDVPVSRICISILKFGVD